jgi:hypothetical protein
MMLRAFNYGGTMFQIVFFKMTSLTKKSQYHFLLSYAESVLNN